MTRATTWKPALPDNEFSNLNPAFNATFTPQKLSLGLVVPIEAYPDTLSPTMADHRAKAQLAERLGFKALWLRDVPFNVPTFGDTGQIFDPLVYLGFLAAQTNEIALGTGSTILTLRHPAHVAKGAASVDQLSNGRLLLGVASGDRPEEFPATETDYDMRGENFQASFEYIRAMAHAYPKLSNQFGTLNGQMDMLPKPFAGRIPMLVTGGSRQHPDWVAKHSDGWITYPRDAASQARVIQDYRARIAEAGEPNKPVIQSLYIDLTEDADTHPSPIHLGFRAGTNFLKRYLSEVRSCGVNHVALNLRFNQAPIEETLQRLADDVFPEFHTEGPSCPKQS
ncbi:MAG: LLM class oxidoreductase [Pseudomonadota bacterium]